MVIVFLKLCKYVFFSLNIDNFNTKVFSKSLKEQEVHVNDAIVILDRCQGARENIEAHGIRFHRFVNVNYCLY